MLRGSHILCSLGTSRTPPGFPFLPQHVKGPPTPPCKLIVSPTCPPRAPRAPRQLPPPQETGDGGEHPVGPRWSRSCSHSKAAPGAAASSGGGHGGTPKTGVVSAPGGLGGGEVSPCVLVASFPNPPHRFLSPGEPQFVLLPVPVLVPQPGDNRVPLLPHPELQARLRPHPEVVSFGGGSAGVQMGRGSACWVPPSPSPFYFLVM